MSVVTKPNSSTNNFPEIITNLNVDLLATVQQVLELTKLKKSKSIHTVAYMA